METPSRPIPEDLLADGETLVWTDIAAPWGNAGDEAAAEAGMALGRRIAATDRPHVAVDFRGRDNIHDTDLARCIMWRNTARERGGRVTVLVDAGGGKIVDFVRLSKLDRVFSLRLT